MKKYNLFISSLLLVFSGSTYASDAFTGNIGVTNNYLWRGQTQSNDKPAVSGGIDYNGETLSAGAWVSNVEFEGDDVNTELDLYAYYNTSFKGINLSTGYIYYGYPDGDNLDFAELQATLAWKNLSLGISTTAHSDFESNFGDDTYIEANLQFEISPELFLNFHAGSYHFDRADDYQDIGISLNKHGFTLLVSKINEEIYDDDVKLAVSYNWQFKL